MTIQYKRLQASDYQLLYRVDVPEISINRLVFDLEIKAFIPAAVPDHCACVIRVETCFGYGSIICYFYLVTAYFLRFFPCSALRPSATYVLVSSTGDVGGL